MRHSGAPTDPAAARRLVNRRAPQTERSLCERPGFCPRVTRSLVPSTGGVGAGLCFLRGNLRQTADSAHSALRQHPLRCVVFWKENLTAVQRIWNKYVPAPTLINASPSASSAWTDLPFW